MSQKPYRVLKKPKAILSLLLIAMLLLGLIVPFAPERSHATTEHGLSLEKQENMNLIAGDAVAKQTMQDLKESHGAVLFESTALAQTAALDDDEMKVKLTYSHKIYYEDFFTRNYRCEFKGKKVVAYCIQPKETPPSEGSYIATEYTNKKMVQALYYMYGYPGYAKKVQPYVSKKDKDDDWSDDESAYALCHMILSYLYDKASMSSDAFMGVSSDTKKLVVKVADYVETLPDAPTDSSISVSKSSVNAAWDWDNRQQKTPAIKLNTHEDNRINVTVPANCTLHRVSGGETKSFAAGKTAKLYGGDSFYFTAPKSVTGTYNSGKLEGSLASFSPYLISITGKQNIFFCGKGETDTVSFSVRWVKWGWLQGRKYCDDGEKARDGIKNVYANLRFEITGNGMPNSVPVSINSSGELVGSDGSKKIELLEGGPYTIKETAQDSRYKEKVSTTFTITGDATYTLPEKALSNITKKGRMQLTKLWIDPETGIESSVIHREEGIAFRIWDAEYVAKGWKFEDVPQVFKDEMVTNRDGVALSKELPIGDYLVQQVTKDQTNWAVKDFSFTITAKENGEPEIKTIDLVNKPALNRFRIEKVDAETGKTIKKAGTKFKVRDEKGNLVTQLNDNHETIDTFVTGADGIARSSETIRVGKYEVIEVTAPNGYVRETKPVAFQVTSDTKPDEIVQVKFKDTPQKGILHIHKLRQVMVETGKGQTLVTAPFPFVKFDIQAAKDIRTADGTLRAEKGKTIQSVMTNEDGNVTTGTLYLGSYHVKETGIYTKVRIYHLTEELISAILETWVNTLMVNGGDPPAEETKEAFTKALGDTLTARYIVEENGHYFETPKGDKAFSYTEEQLWALKDFAESAPDNVMEDSFEKMDASIYNIPKDGIMKTVKLDYAGQDVSVVEKDVTIVNELGMGEAEISKTDLTTGAALPDALIELYDHDKKLVASGTTDSKGKITFKQLPIGKYYFKETAAPDGYVLDSKLHPFEVKENGEIVKCSITNKPKQGSVEITKTDISDGSPLPGAKIDIYDHEKKLIRSGKTDEKGLVSFENLPVGNYFFQETAAPDGYILDSKLYPFEVKKDGEIVKCSITNTPKPTYLLITKVSASTGKPLESAVFGLYDSEKKLIEKQTSDEDGKVLFENLKPGTYFYRELEAPKGYQKEDAWKKITIKQYGQQVMVEVGKPEYYNGGTDG